MAKRKSEKYKRIKCSTLAKLLSEMQYEESIYNLNGDSATQAGDLDPSVGKPEVESLAGLLGGGSADTKSMHSMQSNMTSVSAVTYATDALGITDQTSFLLLDLRDAQDYDFWRIREAINFPAVNIGRDKMLPELYRFKNQTNKLIIIYMGDERKGTQAANLMNEKGYDNVFLLSGGIEQFNEEFHNLVEGRNVPKPRKLIEEEECKRKEKISNDIKARSMQKK